ncbi:MAG TPA: AAA family ATPase [Bacillota bacterium]|nr:AAA family ATPase [Bacillota bacterium]
MIIMINGAFGVGKTSVATELVKEINHSMLYDPEEVGFMLRNILPPPIQQREAVTGDFQDFKLWKELTVSVAASLKDTYNMDLVVPMTICNPQYFEYIKRGFTKIDPQTFHFCLTASKKTIYDRLLERGEEEENWCFQQTDRCLESFSTHDFSQYVETDDRGISEVVKVIKGNLKS